MNSFIKKKARNLAPIFTVRQILKFVKGHGDLVIWPDASMHLFTLYVDLFFRMS